METNHINVFRVNGIKIHLEQLNAFQLESMVNRAKERIEQAQVELGILSTEYTLRFMENPEVMNTAYEQLESD